MLLGFTAVVQSKFYKWIQEYIELLYDSAGVPQNGQKEVSEFNLVNLLEISWAQFLHPILKFYQRQHAELLSFLLLPAKGSKREFKAVEMRKLNEYFTKFVKCVVSFYRKVLEYVMNTFPNPVITESLFRDLEIEMNLKETPPPSTDFMASTMLVLYQCLLGLGNITRHSAHIQATYVEPSKSNSHYQKFTKKLPDSNVKKTYIKPLLYYSKCIQLFPQMCEPYNHIGVIYNSLSEKPNAVVWFLRSQFTLDQNKTIGKYNMATIFRKPWLEDNYSRVLKKQSADISTQDLQVLLLRLMGHIFYPEAYKKPLYYEKTSVDFITHTFFHSTPRPFVRDAENITDALTIMMCFYCIAESEDLDDARTKCGSLLHRFIINYLKHVSRWSPETRDDSGILKNIRFILAFCSDLTSILNFGKEDIILALYEAISAFLDTDEETKANILVAFPQVKKPFRFYLFSEDVKFKQFLPIGFKFHDFDDDHLLKRGDVNLLLGSFLMNLQDIPSFLDNAAVQRINKDSELDGGNRKKAIIEECIRLENALRLQAIVFSSNRLFPDRFGVNGEAQEFILEKVDVPATQSQNSGGGKKKKEKSQKASGKKKTKSPESYSPAVSVDSTHKKIASSLDEIELMIIGHASRFQSNPATDISTDGGLADMVNAIVSEDDGDTESQKESEGTPVKDVKVLTSPPEKQPMSYTPATQSYQMPLQMPPQPVVAPPMDQFPHQMTFPFGYKPQGYYAPPAGYPYYSLFQPNMVPQMAPQMGPLGQSAPQGPQVRQSGPQRPQSGPQGLQSGPQGPQSGPQGPQSGPHVVQMGPQMPQPLYPPHPWQYGQQGNQGVSGPGQYQQYQRYPQYQG